MKQLINRVCRWEYACLCLLVVVNLVLHFSIINNPPKIVLDEVYYVADAQEILHQHNTERMEHPPLGKLLIAYSVALFGDNPVGWRTSSILFGTANIVLLFLICRRLGMSYMATNLAAFLLTFENLSFVQSSLAMLDVFSLTFMLLSFWLYLRGNYPLSVIAVVLATLAKLTGAFAILVILLHWLIVRRDKKIHFMLSMFLAPLSFVLFMPLLQFAIFHHLTNFIDDIKVMLSGTASLTFATVQHPSASPPWEWLILPKVMPYSYNPHYLGAISFTLWALIIPIFLYMIFRAVKKNDAAFFGALWFACTYLVWIAIVLVTDRVTYVYYFYPAIGAICIGLGMVLSQGIEFWKGRQGRARWVVLSGVLFFLVLHLAIFAVLVPLNPWPIENLILS
jgi:dolichyl-phosphate-mannose-protein mannosyltransferase